LNNNILNIIPIMKTFIVIFLIIFSVISINAQNMKNRLPITLVIHGGAGTFRKENMSPDKVAAYKQKLEEALNEGYKILENGGTSIEAIIQAIKIMEDSPLFNAGKGAVFTHNERNKLDASIMDGKILSAGAVAGLTIVKNPIKAAFEIMKNSPHVMMVGSGADKFSYERGLEIVDPEYFYTEERFKQLKSIQDSERQQLDHSSPKGSSESYPDDRKFGTVGAVALDQFGNLAAGTSTGGMTNQKYGRIGDAPIIGAGTYADNNSCAVSATGHGEYFIRSVVAYDIAALMKYKNYSLKRASEQVVNKKLVEMGGEGGVVAVDKNGNISMPFNSAAMYRGYILKKGEANMFI
jgi:L-asparaginase / beta-aspartyl-peptidase